MIKFRLTLLRHGETLAPKNLNGRTDIGLSDQGYQQMSDALTATDTFDQIITSPRQRCLIFAKDISQQRKWPLDIEPKLAEINFGDWDGQAMAILHQQYPTQLAQFWQTPWQFTPPNGEPLSQFSVRVDQAWQRLLEQRNNTLVICHSGVIRYLIAKILGMPLPGNKHLVALNIGYAARVDIDIVIEDNGNVWQTLQWPNSK